MQIMNIKKSVLLLLLLMIFGIVNAFSQTEPMKLLRIDSSNEIIEQEISSGISINDVKNLNIQLIEVIDERYIPIQNLRIFGIDGFIDANRNSVVIFFFYDNKLFGILNYIYHIEHYDLPEPQFIKDETERKNAEILFNELYNKYYIMHNQRLYFIQNKLELFGEFDIISENKMVKYISSNLMIILNHIYYLFESNSYGVSANIAVSYINPSILDEIEETRIFELFDMYFTLIRVHYIFDRIWEK